MFMQNYVRLQHLRFLKLEQRARSYYCLDILCTQDRVLIYVFLLAFVAFRDHVKHYLLDNVTDLS